MDYVLTRSIATQFGAFHRGFMNVADGPALKLFRAEELEQLVVGSKVCSCALFVCNCASVFECARVVCVCDWRRVRACSFC